MIVLRSPETRIENLLLETGLDIVGVSQNSVIQGNVFKGSLFFSTCLGSIVRSNRFVTGDITTLSAIGCLLEGNILLQGGIQTGLGDDSHDNILRGNVVSGGGIRVTGEATSNNRIEFNIVSGGELVVSSGPFGMDGNIVRRNAVRGAGIRLSGMPTQCLVESNMVSGSPGDGILLESLRPFSGGNVIRLNTSVENAGCDINDVGVPTQPNVWENNRFVKSCGNADG